MKKLIILIVIAVVIISFLVYKKYIYNNTINTVVNINTNQIKNTNTNKSLIIPTEYKYKDYTNDQKKIYDTFLKANNQYNNPNYTDGIKLKYYDNNIALFYITNEKIGYYVYIVNMSDMTSVQNNEPYLSVAGNDLDTDKYIFNISENKIYYFDIGDKNFKVLASSTLNNKYTYVEYFGMANSYQIKFDESSNTLSVSYYTPIDNNSEGPNTKIGEKTFVLP